MWLHFDRTGFPLIRVDELGLEVSLLPITKVQFEAFLAEPNQYSDRWYEEVLTQNPRCSAMRFPPEKREGLFLTGILPEEALKFAEWMGNQMTLPTLQQWRRLFAFWARLPFRPKERDQILQATGQHSLKAARGLDRLWQQVGPSTWVEASLMDQGVVEWVRQNGAWVGLGRPRREFQPNLWNPLSDEVKPVRIEVRVRSFGFRLVRLLDREDHGA